MQNIDPVKEAFSTLDCYVDNSPEMLVAVYQNQFLKLETKYRHLILKYQNNYHALQKLKLIEESIPQIILNNPHVQAELRDIAEIKKKLEFSSDRHRAMADNINSKCQQKDELQQKLEQMKQQLIQEKRKYMRLRKNVDLGSVQYKPTITKKYLFQKWVEPEKLQRTSSTKTLMGLELLISFKRGLKQIQKREFRTKDKDIRVVLKNIRIKKNLHDVFFKRDFNRSKARQEGGPSKLSLRATHNPNSGQIFQVARLETDEGDRGHPSHLESLSSIELYSRVCQNKAKLEAFNMMLHDLLYRQSI